MCRKTCHVDQAGEWRDLQPGMPSEEVDPSGQPLRVGDWRWYCGLHCLADAAPSAPFVRVAGAAGDDLLPLDEVYPPPVSEPAPSPLQAAPGQPGHTEPGAAQKQAPRARVSWADDVDGLQFGQFPAQKTKM